MSADIGGKVEPFHILTCRRKGESHHETALTIDWTGITDNELKILARNALIHDFQARCVRDKKNPVPERATIIAKNMVHQPPVALLKYTAPPPKVQLSREMQQLMKMLTPQELLVLLGE